MSRIPKPQSDQVAKHLSKVKEMYSVFIEDSIRPLSELPKEFIDYFDRFRIISFRKSLPKTLNSHGETLCKEPKLWVLWLFVLHIDNKATNKEILNMMKEAITRTGNKEAIANGVRVFTENCSKFRVNEEDIEELEEIMGGTEAKVLRELETLSNCGRFTLVRIGGKQRKTVNSSLVVVPVEKNEWVNECECESACELGKLLQMANYAYIPCIQ